MVSLRRKEMQDDREPGGWRQKVARYSPRTQRAVVELEHEPNRVGHGALMQRKSLEAEWVEEKDRIRRRFRACDGGEREKG